MKICLRIVVAMHRWYDDLSLHFESSPLTNQGPESWRTWLRAEQGAVSLHTVSDGPLCSFSSSAHVRVNDIVWRFFKASQPHINRPSFMFWVCMHACLHGNASAPWLRVTGLLGSVSTWHLLHWGHNSEEITHQESLQYHRKLQIKGQQTTASPILVN